MFIQPHDPDFMPEPIYPEYIPLEDEHVLSAEEQPLPRVVSPNVESPEYVAESDPEEDPEEYEDDETEDGPVDYPMDGGDDGDDDDGYSSGDEADDEDDEEDDKKEEHLAPADSPVVPVIDPVLSADDTKAFETDEAAPTPAEFERLLALPIPPPSPLTLLSSPLPQIPSPPLPPPPSSLHLPPHVPISVPLPFSPLLPLPASLSIPSPVDHREDTSEAELPPRKREVSYGIRDVWVDPTETVEKVAPTTLEGVNARVTELAAVQEQDTQDMCAVIKDTQDKQTQIYQRVDI
nr:hypothetical protein [Tanacetum cinerariifolium]